MKLVDFLKVFQETEINGYLTVMQQCSCCASEYETGTRWKVVEAK